MLTLEFIWGKFTQFVNKVAADFKALDAEHVAMKNRITTLETALRNVVAHAAQQSMNGAVQPNTTSTQPDIVAIDPATGRGVTQQQMDADKKLRMRIQFSETEA